MPCRTLKHNPVTHKIAVPIRPRVRILHAGHGRVKDDGGGSHAACDLVEYVINGVTVFDNPAVVNVSAKKKNLGNHGRVALGVALLVDRLQLGVCQYSNRNSAGAPSESGIGSNLKGNAVA